MITILAPPACPSISTEEERFDCLPIAGLKAAAVTLLFGLKAAHFQIRPMAARTQCALPLDAQISSSLR
jgi:hypothetical protein